MAKPSYFYGIHAVQAILQYRGMDGLALFIQDNKIIQDHKVSTAFPSQIPYRSTDPAIDTMLALAATYGISVQITQRDKLTKLADSPQHQGVVLQARAASLGDEHDLRQLIQTYLAEQKFILLLVFDQITDPNNLGACLRSAAAMGVAAVILPKHHSVSITPAVAKVAVGATEIVPVLQVTNLARSLSEVKKMGIFVYGTALDETAKAAKDCDLTGNVAIVMGSEGDGIRRLTAESCDQLVYIPMAGTAQGHVQSLNVSVATGMMLYEACRQRTAL